jgi:signal transduction histidine kinase
MLDVRRVVEGLRPPALDELGLRVAIEQAVDRLCTASAMETDVTVTISDQLPAAVEVAAYRIVTEAVTNVVRHAAARRCRVSIRASGRALAVEVADDGQGIDPGITPSGHGLSTMHERAEELGGTLVVESADGTIVRASIPIAFVPPQPDSPSLAAVR